MAGAKTAKRPLATGSRATKAQCRYAHVMKPEYLAEIERMRLMDDDFMSKCLENAPECIELMLQTCFVVMRRRCTLKFSRREFVNLRIQKKGGVPCAKHLKESRRAVSTRP